MQNKKVKTMWYNIKMRAENNGRHISGAERIVRFDDIEMVTQLLTKRALWHANGTPNNIHIGVHALYEEPQCIPALKITEANTLTPNAARQCLAKMLDDLGINVECVLKQFYGVSNLRGAMLLHIPSLKRLEPDKERGIRVSCMDFLNNTETQKNHKKEALVLASKVIYHPDIVAELCISDDPDYTTGYFASKKLGYLRLTHIKDAGDPHGGRIILYAGSLKNVQACIDYLQNSPIFVTYSTAENII